MNPESPKPFVIEEVAGTDIPGVPMSEEQAYHLHEDIDPMVDQLIANLEIEKKRRELADAYMMRTIPETRLK